MTVKTQTHRVFPVRHPKRGRGRPWNQGRGRSKLVTQSNYDRGSSQSSSSISSQQGSFESLSPIVQPFVQHSFHINYNQVQNPLFNKDPNIDESASKSDCAHTLEIPRGTTPLHTPPPPSETICPVHLHSSKILD